MPKKAFKCLSRIEKILLLIYGIVVIVFFILWIFTGRMGKLSAYSGSNASLDPAKIVDVPLFPTTPPPPEIKAEKELNEFLSSQTPVQIREIKKSNKPITLEKSTEGAVKVVANVPEYTWWNGCSPTAAGMIIGWWDTQVAGCGNLYDGNAAVWGGNGSSGTRRMVASQAHIDAGHALGFTYGSWRNHTADSIADFFKTENGGTSRSDMAAGFVNFAAWDDPTTANNESYQAIAVTDYRAAGWTFLDYKAQIDSGRPVHLGLTSIAGGHSITGIGYDDTGGKQDYLAWSTWGGWGIVEGSFDSESWSGYNFEVYGATSLIITPKNAPSQPAVSLSPANPKTNDDLVVTASGSVDPGGLPVSYEYAWYKNNVLQDDLTTNTVSSSRTLKGQIWRCVVTPTNGTLRGTSNEIQVIIGNTNPVLNPVGDQSSGVGINLRFTLTASDLDANDSLSFYAVGLPSGASLSSTSGVFSWTPTVAQQGVFADIRLTVTDGTTTDFELIDITVLGGPANTPNGTLIRTSNESTIYVIFDGQRRHIISPNVFTNSGFSWSKVNVVSSSIANLYPVGANIYKVWKAAGTSNIYLMSQGIKYPITNTRFFSYCGFSKYPVSEIPADFLATKVQNMNLYLTQKTTSSPNVYLIFKGFKRRIADPATLRHMGFRWNEIKIVSTATINQNRTVLPAINRLITGTNGRIYLIQWGKKRWITSSAKISQLGFSRSSIVKVPQGLVDIYPTGPKI